MGAGIGLWLHLRTQKQPVSLHACSDETSRLQMKLNEMVALIVGSTKICNLHVIKKEPSFPEGV